jgi:hypothetical protein
LSQFTYRAVERARLPPGGAANLLVRKSHPDYDKYVAWAHDTARDPREWKMDEDDRGIWIGLGAQIQIRQQHANTWRRFTDDELAAIYGPKPAGQQP